MQERISTRRYIKRYLKRCITGPWSLICGLSVSLKYFFDPRRIVTEQYPENKKNGKQTEAIQPKNTGKNYRNAKAAGEPTEEVLSPEAAFVEEMMADRRPAEDLPIEELPLAEKPVRPLRRGMPLRSHPYEPGLRSRHHRPSHAGNDS